MLIFLQYSLQVHVTSIKSMQWSNYPVCILEIKCLHFLDGLPTSDPLPKMPTNLKIDNLQLYYTWSLWFCLWRKKVQIAGSPNMYIDHMLYEVLKLFVLWCMVYVVPLCLL